MAKILKGGAVPGASEIDDAIDPQQHKRGASQSAIDAAMELLRVRIAQLEAHFGTAALAGGAVGTGNASGNLSVGSPPPPGGLLWSDPDTWGLGGAIPGTGALVGADVTIATGMTVVIDTSVEVGTMSIASGATLTAVNSAGADILFKYHSIGNQGTFTIGTPGARQTRKITFRAVGDTAGPRVRGASFIGNAPTANDSLANDQNGIHRAFLMHGGSITKFYGAIKDHVKRLGAHVAVAATSLTLESSPAGWQVGDRCAISTTTYWGNSYTEFLRITSIAGATIGFEKITAENVDVPGGLQYARWGVLQYLAPGGVSLAPVAITAGSLAGHVRPGTEAQQAAVVAAAVAEGQTLTIDERAEVVNLTRTIRFDTDADTPWTANKDGQHIMWISGAEVVLDGVESHRGGMRGLLGRYPFHAHMMSWAFTTGAWIPPATSKANLNVVTRCSVWNSANRAYTCHGTAESTWSDNVAAEVLGHALFLEDGSEIRNTFTGNVMLGIRDPGAAFRIKTHDADPAGYWISNLYNSFDNNTVADCDGTGVWNAPATMMLGPSSPVTFNDGLGAVNRLPRFMKPILWRNFREHGSKIARAKTAFGPSDQAGTFGDLLNARYFPTEDGTTYIPGSYATPVPAAGQAAFFTLENLESFKSPTYQNSVGLPLYWKWKISSHRRHGASGKTLDGGFFSDCFHIPETLNNPAEVPVVDPFNQTTGVAAYHWTLNLRRCVYWGYDSSALIEDTDYNTNGRGHIAPAKVALGLWDSYLYAVAWNSERNEDCAFIDSIPAYQLPPAHLRGRAPYNIAGTSAFWNGQPYALTGAFRDKHGWLGAAGKWWVRDWPFFTSGQATTPAYKSAQLASGNGVMVDGPFFGVHPQKVDLDNDEFYTQIYNVSRLSAINGSVIDTWDIPAAGATFANMRHFAAAPGGIYLVDTTTPAGGNSVQSVHRISGLNNAAHFFYMSVEWDFTDAPNVQVVGNTTDLGSDNMRTQSIATLSAHASNTYQRRIFTEVASSAALVASATSAYWKDTANGRCWLKVYGGYTGNRHPTQDWYAAGPTGVWRETDPRWDGGYGDYEVMAQNIIVGVFPLV